MMRGSIRPVKNSLKSALGSQNAKRTVATRQWGESKDQEKTHCDAPSTSKQVIVATEIAEDAAKRTEGQDCLVAGVRAKKKTLAELDEELRLKLEGVSGEGGSAGIEYESGKAVGLKRSVRENMFIVI